jgi:hypothetical protein
MQVEGKEGISNIKNQHINRGETNDKKHMASHRV